MKLSAKTEIDVPVGFVFDSLADHDHWMAEARRRGAEVEPLADRPLSGVGAGWRLRFPFRGKVRNVLLWIEDLRPGQDLAYAFEGKAFEGRALMELTALSARRTRLRVGLTVKPRTLAARLLINTLRLARRKVQARYDKRLGQLAGLIQARYAENRAG
jgi:hypothetical protein